MMLPLYGISCGQKRQNTDSDARSLKSYPSDAAIKPSPPLLLPPLLLMAVLRVFVPLLVVSTDVVCKTTGLSSFI